MKTGQIFKYTGSNAIVRPDAFGQTRRDVVIKNGRKDYTIGNKIKYNVVEKNGRSFAVDIELYE
jgi:hypothetical protein